MEPTLQDTIEAVTDAVSSVAASLVTADTSATATTAGSGAGDSRPPGEIGRQSGGRHRTLRRIAHERHAPRRAPPQNDLALDRAGVVQPDRWRRRQRLHAALRGQQ